MKKATYINLLAVCLIILYALMYLNRKCEAESMLLTEDDFPADTIFNDVRSPIAEMPEVSAGFTASYGESAIYQEVGRFPLVTSAKREFEIAKRNASVQTKYHGPWETPPELSNTSSIFQDYYVVCGKVDTKYQCRMIGQYEEYYMFFSTYISDNGLTLEMFDDLLKRVDGHVEVCFHE